MLKLDVIEIGESDYTSPMIPVEAPGKNSRPCTDCRRLNKIIKKEYFSLPHIEEKVKKVSSANFITVLDIALDY